MFSISALVIHDKILIIKNIRQQTGHCKPCGSPPPSCLGHSSDAFCPTQCDWILISNRPMEVQIHSNMIFYPFCNHMTQRIFLFELFYILQASLFLNCAGFAFCTYSNVTLYFHQILCKLKTKSGQEMANIHFKDFPRQCGTPV